MQGGSTDNLDARALLKCNLKKKKKKTLGSSCPGKEDQSLKVHIFTLRNEWHWQPGGPYE